MAGKNFTTFLIYLNVWETKELICGFFYISTFGFVFLAASFLLTFLKNYGIIYIESKEEDIYGLLDLW